MVLHPHLRHHHASPASYALALLLHIHVQVVKPDMELGGGGGQTRGKRQQMSSSYLSVVACDTHCHRNDSDAVFSMDDDEASGGGGDVGGGAEDTIWRMNKTRNSVAAPCGTRAMIAAIFASTPPLLSDQ